MRSQNSIFFFVSFGICLHIDFDINVFLKQTVATSMAQCVFALDAITSMRIFDKRVHLNSLRFRRAFVFQFRKIVMNLHFINFQSKASVTLISHR